MNYADLVQQKLYFKEPSPEAPQVALIAEADPMFEAKIKQFATWTYAHKELFFRGSGKTIGLTE